MRLRPQKTALQIVDVVGDYITHARGSCLKMP